MQVGPTGGADNGAQVIDIPLDLTLEQWNAIIEDEVGGILDQLELLEKTVYPRGLPGEVPMTPDQRLARYANPAVTNPADIPHLRNPHYLALMNAGMAQPLVSPFWQRLTIIPDFYEKIRRDFITLAERKLNG